MHETAYHIGAKFLELYAADRPNVVVEIGSYNVNGSLRSACPSGSMYIGLDMEHGPGVDILVRPREPLPLRGGFADIVLTSSQMEHDPCFWRTFLEMIRITKPGGLLYVNAPSNGFYHTYPLDCWRFYPDAGKALVDWAQSVGYEVSLVESFVAEQFGDQWNDFVSVFRVSPTIEDAQKPFLSDIFACTNVWKPGLVAPEKRRDLTQDADIMRQQAEELSELKRKLAENTALYEAHLREFTILEARLAAEEARRMSSAEPSMDQAAA